MRPSNPAFVASPLAQMARSKAFPGILLGTCAIVAILLANSGWAEPWDRLCHTTLAIRLGDLELQKSLAHWTSDGLMVVFFFFVGLEVKHEILDGELQSLRQAALPLAAALGGMIAPAGIYMATAWLCDDATAARGWGIPMATDIAFALGVLIVLGKRVPPGLKVFLATLAIADDIGAVLVIAVFYTEQIAWQFLGLGALVLTASFACNKLGVRRTWPYAVFGIAIWLLFLKSGVHATIAGVALAFTIPARRALHEREFSRRGRELLDEFDEIADPSPRTNQAQLETVYELQHHAEAVQAPLQRMEHGLHPFVSFFVVPVFALANAGVAFEHGVLDAFANAAGLGVFLGLAIGKPIGVLAATWLACRFLGSSLPSLVSWRHIFGAGCLAGIGFTMSLFLNGLAFPSGSAAFHASKLAIVTASVFAGTIGYLILRTGRSVAT